MVDQERIEEIISPILKRLDDIDKKLEKLHDIDSKLGPQGDITKALGKDGEIAKKLEEISKLLIKMCLTLDKLRLSIGQAENKPKD